VNNLDRVRRYYRNQGYTFASEAFYTFINMWDSWYRGKVEAYHNMKIYNGEDFVEREMKKLCMAKKICEDKAGFIINDRLEFNIEKEEAKSRIDNVLADNDFMVEGSQLLEKMYALGTGAMVEFKDAMGGVTIDYIGAFNIIPLTQANENKINKIAFVSKIDKETYYISEHTYITDESDVYYKQYKIENKKVTIDDDCKFMSWADLTEQEVESKVYEVYYSPVKLYQLIKPNIVNNIDIDSKLGISCFANAIDQLQTVDMNYDSYFEEISNGKSRIFVNEEMAKIKFDENGKPQRYFAKNDTTFYSLKMGNDAKENIIHDIPELRTEQLSGAMCDSLSMLSFKVNLGNGYYNFKDGKVEKTATEVISEDSDLYRQVKKDELVINQALVDMCRAILYLSGEDFNTEIKIKFDDSIVIDDQQLMKDSLLELGAGVIDRIEYFKKVYRMTDEQAKKKNDEIEARKQERGDVEVVDFE